MRGMLQRGAEALPWLMVAVLMGLLGRTWFARIPYPYDLEWMEGGMVAHAWRLSRGEPLYVAPNPDFVPYIYPPGYSSLLALVSVPVGLSPSLGRILSLAATLAAAAAITWILRQRQATWVVSIAAGAVFIGCYRASGAFFDMVRPDSMYVALLGWSVALALTPRRGAPVASGLLLAAAFLMKQNAAAFGLPILAGLALRGPRPALQFLAASVLPALASVGWLQWRSSGMFLTYLLEVPRSHPSVWPRLFPGTPLELGTALPVATAASGAWLVWRQADRGRLPVALAAVLPVAAGMLVAWYATRNAAPEGVAGHVFTGGPATWGLVAGAVVGVMAVFDRRGKLAWDVALVALVTCTAVAVAAVMRAHNGGYLNVHIHMFWAVALVFGLVLTRLPPWLAGVVVSVQLLWSAASTGGRDLRPTEADRAAGDRVVESLRGREGPVLAPYSAWLPTYAGHPPSLHYMAVWDLDYKGGPLHKELDVIRASVRDGYWPTALDGEQAFPYGLRKHYREEGEPIIGSGRALQPKTGWRAKPERLRVPK